MCYTINIGVYFAYIAYIVLFCLTNSYLYILYAISKKGQKQETHIKNR